MNCKVMENYDMKYKSKVAPQCEEVTGLHLEDGTKKIFLKDRRIEKLDTIVREVKQSEEWEGVKMNILEIGLQQGLEEGVEQGLVELICKKLRKGKDIQCIAEEVEEPLERVEKICHVAEKYAPEYAFSKVYEEYCKIKQEQN